VPSTAVAITTTTTATRPPRLPPARASNANRPPLIVDRGTDHVAIARSLLVYVRWLEWHHPVPALLARAYAHASPIDLNVSREVVELARRRMHFVEVDIVPLAFVVLSALPNVVSFRMTEQLAVRALVDASGHVVDRVGPVTVVYGVSIMRFGPDEPWRVNLVEQLGPAVEVQL
jgi:hypothetical protein